MSIPSEDVLSERMSLLHTILKEISMSLPTIDYREIASTLWYNAIHNSWDETIFLAESGKHVARIEGEGENKRVKTYRISKFLSANIYWLFERGYCNGISEIDDEMRNAQEIYWREGITRDLYERQKNAVLLHTDILPERYNKAIIEIAEMWSKYSDLSSVFNHTFLEGQAVRDNYGLPWKGETLAKSCMVGYDGRGGEPTRLYVENPDKVRLLYITEKSSGKPVGRALVWNTDQGRVFMDRVYPSNMGTHTRYAREVAQKNGWVYRKADSADAYEISEDMEITVTLRDVNAYPWMDTMRFCTPGNGEFCISNLKGSYNMQDTGNRRPWNGRRVRSGNEEGIWSEWEDEYIDENDAVWSNYVDSYLTEENAVFIGYIDDYVPEGHDNLVWTYLDEPALIDDVSQITSGRYRGLWALSDDDDFTLVMGGGFVPNEEAVFLTCGRWEGEYASCDDAIRLWDDEFCYFDDNFTELTAGSYKGEYALDCEIVELWNGDVCLESEVVLIDAGEHEGEYELEDEAVYHDHNIYFRDFDPGEADEPEEAKEELELIEL